MINAREELLEHVADRRVDLVRVCLRQSWDEPPLVIEGGLEEVLSKLSFTYDAGYGRQELFGFIWYVDGTWSERMEYDGSEWWVHKEAPDKRVAIDIPY